MITTLILQMCLYFGSVYFALFAVLEVAVQVYKWSTLPYSAGALGSEATLLLVFIVVEWLRIQLGKRGNLTNGTISLATSLLLLLPSLLAVLYSLLWQNYVLRIEVIACSIQIGLQSGTFILYIIKFISVLTQPGYWK